jgi:metal-dependent hydrolase (beta-lactamase superfamily II)
LSTKPFEIVPAVIFQGEAGWKNKAEQNYLQQEKRKKEERKGTPAKAVVLIWRAKRREIVVF